MIFTEAVLALYVRYRSEFDHPSFASFLSAIFVIGFDTREFTQRETDNIIANGRSQDREYCAGVYDLIAYHRQQLYRLERSVKDHPPIDFVPVFLERIDP